MCNKSIPFIVYGLSIFISFTFAEVVIAEPNVNSNSVQNLRPEHSPHIAQDLQTIYEKYKNFHGGENANYIPALMNMNPNDFSIVVITTQGKVYSVGNATIPFAIESISKLFVYALALQDYGEAVVAQKVGLNATGFSYNSILSIELAPHHFQNPIVNSGAIQVTSLIKGKDSKEKWQRVLHLFKALSDGKPYLGETVYKSESGTNQHNRAMTLLLDSYGLIYSDPQDALDRYTKACSVMVNTQQLALMAATMANGGVNPVTHQRILAQKFIRDVLAQMTTNGLYENSGAWWSEIGLPAKAGVGGGIIAVVPHKMAIAVFSPPLDSAGNSVRGQKVIAELAAKWHLNLLN